MAMVVALAVAMVATEVTAASATVEMAAARAVVGRAMELMAAVVGAAWLAMCGAMSRGVRSYARTFRQRVDEFHVGVAADSRPTGRSMLRGRGLELTERGEARERSEDGRHYICRPLDFS